MTLPLGHRLRWPKKPFQRTAKGAVFYDPYINYKLVEGQVTDFEDFISRIDLAVVMVGHNQIIENQSRLTSKIVLDTRNVLHEIDTVRL